jgi:hypothetical protein
MAVGVVGTSWAVVNCETAIKAVATVAEANNKWCVFWGMD